MNLLRLQEDNWLKNSLKKGLKTMITNLSDVGSFFKARSKLRPPKGLYIHGALPPECRKICLDPSY
jgi:hypothetical protein